MMNWFFNIGAKKWLHIVVCFAIVCVVALLDMTECERPNVNVASIGAMVAFLMGLLKEIVWCVLLRRGYFSFKNMFADFVGSAIGFVFVLLAMSLGE